MFLVHESAPDVFAIVPMDRYFVVGEGDEAVQHPPQNLLHWSDEECAEVGVYRVPAAAIPPGKISVGDTFARIEGVVTHVPTLEDAPPPVPTSVTPLQARRALRAAGLLTAVQAAIEGLGEEAEEAWEYAIAIERDNPLLAAAAETLELTPEQLDDLFTAAAAL